MYLINSNPFANSEIAASYEDWYHTIGHRADVQEKALLQSLLAGFSQAHTILEVGCGTGHYTRWFGELGQQAVGLDLSRAMLEKAVSLNSPVYLQGDALTLPFVSKSFDLVVLITTLEFLPKPRLALAEALRVAGQGIILGVLNAESRVGREYKSEGESVWGAAHFFSPNEIKRIIMEITGEQARVVWRTTLWPFWPGALPLPWGGFIGMAVKKKGTVDRGNMTDISALVSLYPLGQEDLSPAIDEALSIFREHGLAVNPGSMSTLISGNNETIFAALQAAFQHAAGEERVVMVVTFSNACPLPEPEM